VLGNNEQINQEANLSLFNIKMMTTRMTCESLKRGSEKLFPLFPFSNLFYLFLSFLFYQIQRLAKTNMYWKRRKENGGFGVREKIQMQMVKEIGITTGLPPSESFMFIVREQDCLHTFDD
jgi:hypothetical protein